MMRLCMSHDCMNWCQWRISGVTGEGRDTHFNLCQVHKEEIMATPLLKDQKAIFVGAIPDTVEIP